MFFSYDNPASKSQLYININKENVTRQLVERLVEGGKTPPAIYELMQGLAANNHMLAPAVLPATALAILLVTWDLVRQAEMIKGITADPVKQAKPRRLCANLSQNPLKLEIPN